MMRRIWSWLVWRHREEELLPPIPLVARTVIVRATGEVVRGPLSLDPGTRTLIFHDGRVYKENECTVEEGTCH